MNFFDRLAEAIDPDAFGDTPDYGRQEEARRRLSLAMADLAPEFEIVQKLRSWGGDYYVTADYGADGGQLKLNKANLGNFLHALIRHGGSVVSTHAMSTEFPNAYVQAMVRLPAKAVAAFEADSGVRLEKPSTLSPA